MGHYRIAFTFPFSIEQWRHVLPRVKAQKTRQYFMPSSAKDWLDKHNLTAADFKDVVNLGRWRFDVIVIECIAFDRNLYESMKKGENSEQEGCVGNAVE